MYHKGKEGMVQQKKKKRLKFNLEIFLSVAEYLFIFLKVLEKAIKLLARAIQSCKVLSFG